MNEKLFTLIDPTTGSVAFGLERQPATNGLFLYLSSAAGEKNWRDLDVNESAAVLDKSRDAYRVVRVR